MKYLILESSSIYALKKYGFLPFEGEKIILPDPDTLEDKLFTIDNSKSRWSCDGLATYVHLHTAKDGRKVVASFDYFC